MVQVALALVLLICSGLMIRTFQALMHVSPGFADPDALQVFHLYIPETRVPDTQREGVVRMQQEIENKIAAIPGVYLGELRIHRSTGGIQSERSDLRAGPHLQAGRASAHPPFQIHLAGLPLDAWEPR